MWFWSLPNKPLIPLFVAHFSSFIRFSSSFCPEKKKKNDTPVLILWEIYEWKDGCTFFWLLSSPFHTCLCTHTKVKLSVYFIKMDHSSKTPVFRPGQHSACQDACWPHPASGQPFLIVYFSLCVCRCHIDNNAHNIKSWFMLWAR